MAATRRVLKHIEVQVAKGKRRCSRNKKKHAISKGDAFLFVREEGQGYSNYCVECAPAILERAREDLDSIDAGLRGRTTGGSTT